MIMEAPNDFKIVIKKYMDQRAANDELFAVTYVKPGKSIDECCRYILGEANKRGNAVFMSDEEVYGLAVHYYDEDDIKVEKVSSRCRVSSSTAKVKLTEEEQNAAREAAIKRLTEEQYQSLKKKPAKKKVDESIQQMSLF